MGGRSCSCRGPMGGTGPDSPLRVKWGPSISGGGGGTWRGQRLGQSPGRRARRGLRSRSGASGGPFDYRRRGSSDVGDLAPSSNSRTAGSALNHRQPRKPPQILLGSLEGSEDQVTEATELSTRGAARTHSNRCTSADRQFGRAWNRFTVASLTRSLEAAGSSTSRKRFESRRVVPLIARLSNPPTRKEDP
jgi:hypothetical protein